MQRVAILGPGGAGKSTLADELGARTGLPVIHLDRYFWRPNWVETPRDEWRARQEELFAADAWIADGNYSATADVRLRRADTVLLLDIPIWRTIPRALRRSIGNHGRSVQAEGCPERVDPAFLWWIATYRRRSRPKVFALVKAHAPDAKFLVLRSPGAVRRFLASVP
jgi:adenylate kinase family enzyme